MKTLFNNPWFNLAIPVLIFFATVAHPGIGAALLFVYFVAWGINKQR
jgi:hypothetical protein